MRPFFPLGFALGLWVLRTAPTKPWRCSGVGVFWGGLLELQLVFAICLAIGISDRSLSSEVLPLPHEKGVQDSCVLVPEEGSAPRPQGSLLLTFPTLGNPSSTRHHGRVRRGPAGSHLRLSLPAPAVLLVTSRSSSLHHSFLQGCCGMERLMNKSIPLGAEAAKLGCEQRSSAGAGGLTAGVAPLVNSPQDGAAAAKRAALIAFWTCFIYQSAQYAALSCCPTFFPDSPAWKWEQRFGEEPWGAAGSSWAQGAAASPCHTAVTQLPLCRAEGSLAASRRTALCG